MAMGHMHPQLPSRMYEDARIQWERANIKRENAAKELLKHYGEIMLYRNSSQHMVKCVRGANQAGSCTQKLQVSCHRTCGMY